MKSYLSALAISALLLTGCSTPTPTSQPEYDAVELIRYQACVNGFIEENEWSETLIDRVTEFAINKCEKFLPNKK